MPPNTLTNPEIDAAIAAIYAQYQAKDYWCDATVIASRIAARDAARSENPYVDLPTDAEIAECVHAKSFGFCHGQYQRIVDALSARDLTWLTSHVRYDQPVTLRLFALATGKRVLGLSNRQLQKVFEQLLKEE